MNVLYTKYRKLLTITNSSRIMTPAPPPPQGNLEKLSTASFELTNNHICDAPSPTGRRRYQEVRLVLRLPQS